MLKKLIAYQRLLLNSTSSLGCSFKKPFVAFILIYIALFIFDFYLFPEVMTNFYIFFLAITNVWIFDMILNGERRLYEIVPVSRKYVVLNIFLLSIITIVLTYVAFKAFLIAYSVIHIGFAWVTGTQGFLQWPPGAIMNQAIGTTRGNLLMLFILAIIMFAGTSIAFIKNLELRCCIYVLLTLIGFALLLILKSYMITNPNSGKFEFIESFSMMPQSSTILACIAIVAVIVCIASIFMGYKLYVEK